MILLHPNKDIPPLGQIKIQLQTVLNNPALSTPLLAGLNYNTLVALQQLGVDILNTRSQSTKTRDSDDYPYIDKAKLWNLISEEKENQFKFEKLTPISASVSSLIRLQAKLIHSLRMLYILLGSPNASINDIYHLIVVIAAIHRAIDIRKREVKMEAEFAHVREMAQIKAAEQAFIELIEKPPVHEMETGLETFPQLEVEIPEEDEESEEDAEISASETPETIASQPRNRSEDKRPLPPLPVHFVPQSPITFKTELEIVLKKQNALTNQVYDNSMVPLQFEARAFKACQDLNFSENKSKDSHSFLFTQEKPPHEKVSVSFKHDGVHFSAEKGSLESLALMQRLIEAYEKSVESLSLKTDWRIHAQDSTVGFKAMSVANACGANMNAISGIKIDEATPVKPSEVAKAQRELKTLFKK